MSVDDRGREIHELAVIDTRLLAQHVKRRLLVDPVALHQDALGPLDQRAAPEGSLQIVILGEAAQHDVDRALPVIDVLVVDMREHTPLGRLVDEPRIRLVKQHDHRASRLAHDLVDQRKRVLRALPEPHERDIGPLPDSRRAHVLHFDLTRDHLVSERNDDGRHERQAVLSLVGDQNA